MTVNKDEIRKELETDRQKLTDWHEWNHEACGMAATAIAHAQSLLASDDAKDEENARLRKELREEIESNAHKESIFNDELRLALQQSEEARKAAEWELEEMREARDVLRGMTISMSQDVAALCECLAWYADEEVYEDQPTYTEPWQPQEYETAEVWMDKGERARTLLAELDRKDTQPKEGDDGN